MSLCVEDTSTCSLEKHRVHEYVVFYHLNKKSKRVKSVQKALLKSIPVDFHWPQAAPGMITVRATARFQDGGLLVQFSLFQGGCTLFNAIIRGQPMNSVSQNLVSKATRHRSIV